MATKSQSVRLARPVWFNTGLKMQDGKTPRTVAAHTRAEYDEFKKKESVIGYEQVEMQDENGKPYFETVEQTVKWTLVEVKGKGQGDDAPPPPPVADGPPPGSGVTGTGNTKKSKKR